MTNQQALDLITIRTEPFAAFKASAAPMLQQHWRELATYDDIPLAIDDAQYEQLEQQGQLLIVTMRTTESESLIGYAVYFLSRHPHYSASLQAKEDIIFVTKAARRLGLGRNLLQQSEVLLRQAGVQVVLHGMKLTHPALGELLASEGYRPVETIYSKRLDGG